MKTQTEKSWWVKVSEMFVAATGKAESGKRKAEIFLPALDIERNDKALVELRTEDPALVVLLSYAQVHIENNLRKAFDPALSPEQQMEFKNRAAGVAALIEDIETTRARLKAELIERQKRDGASRTGNRK